MSENVITLAPDSITIPLALASFRRDDRLWPRRGLVRSRVREFARLYRDEGCNALPPILVLAVEQREYLGDGWHRCAAAESLGWTQLPALVGRVDRIEDVYLEAVSSAATAQKPLTTAEKRAAVDRLLAMKLGYSDHGLARLAGVSQPFVGKRKRLLEKGVNDPSPTLPPTPAQREARKLVQAVVALGQLARTPRHYSGGEPIAPVAEIRQATTACRNARADVILATLERWAARLREGKADTGTG